jgi:L-iditol 2-dehydrogenase
MLEVEMRGAMLRAVHEIEVVDRPIPLIGDEDVLLRIIASGVCGSDLHAYEGRHPFRRPPIVLGHEPVGVIADIGKSVRGLSRGDPAVAVPLETCGQCSACLSNHSNRCKAKVFPASPGWDGTLAEFFRVPAAQVVPLPSDLPWDVGVLTEPFAVAAHAVQQLEISCLRRVVVLGGGSVGIATAACALHVGADTAAVVDICERNLAVAKDVGANPVYGGTGVIARVQEALGGVADAVFVTSDYPGVLSDAVHLCDAGASIVLVALFGEEPTLDASALVLGEVSLIGSVLYTRRDFDLALDVLSATRESVRKMVTHRFPLELASRAFEVLRTREGDPIKVILECSVP